MTHMTRYQKSEVVQGGISQQKDMLVDRVGYAIQDIAGNIALHLNALAEMNSPEQKERYGECHLFVGKVVRKENEEYYEAYISQGEDEATRNAIATIHQVDPKDIRDKEGTPSIRIEVRQTGEIIFAPVYTFTGLEEDYHTERVHFKQSDYKRLAHMISAGVANGYDSVNVIVGPLKQILKFNQKVVGPLDKRAEQGHKDLDRIMSE